MDIALTPPSTLGACREKAQTIVGDHVKHHERELAGWTYLQKVMEVVPPTDEEEAALWAVLIRARNNRY